MTANHQIKAARPTAIDLFSGAGGLSLGFEQAGFDVLCAAEYDPIHAATHLLNFPQSEMVCADVGDLGAEALRRAAAVGWKSHGRVGAWNGELDVLVGGPPCQGFSTGGKREINDGRNQMVFAFARLIGELKPRYFVMENVQGLASFLGDEEGELLLDKLVYELRSHSYQVLRPFILNACAFGVPQDRRRLFLVGARDGEVLPSAPQRTTAGRPRRPGAPLPAGSDVEGASHCPSVWEAIGDLPEVDRIAELLKTDELELSLDAVEALERAASHYVQVLRRLVDDPHDLSYQRVWDPGLLTSSYRTVHTPDVLARFQATEPGATESVSRFIRLHRSGVAPTLRAGSHYERGAFNAPRPIHPVADRVISVREAARLHSFPDWFRFHWTKWHGFRQVGNSVPPLVGRAVARTVVEALAMAPARPTDSIRLGDPSLVRLENKAAASRLGANQERMPRNAQRVRAVELQRAVE